MDYVGLLCNGVLQYTYFFCSFTLGTSSHPWHHLLAFVVLIYCMEF